MFAIAANLVSLSRATDNYDSSRKCDGNAHVNGKKRDCDAECMGVHEEITM